MGINRGTDRFLPLLNGNVLTAGGSLNLAKGQLGIFETKNNTKNGLKAVSNFAGIPKNREFEMRVGVAPISVTRTQDNKAKSTRAFRLDEVESISVYAPSLDKKVDEFYIGYDGINASTALTFQEGDNEELDIELSGEGIGLMGYTDAIANVKIYFDKEEGSTETNQEIVEKAVERLKNTRLKENVPITDFITVTPINSENGALTGTSHTFYNLVLTDRQGSNDLADVQAQYNSDVVTRTGFGGMTSTYTVLRATTDGAPADYVSTSVGVRKPCPDCPAGYDSYTAGVLYSVRIQDEGADLTTTIDDLPGFVTGSVVKQGQDAANADMGMYTVLVDNKLTDAEIGTFVTANPTATVALIQDLAALCEDIDETDIAWVAGEACFASTETYTIQLADDDCSGNRLADLQAAYPDLSITVTQSDTGATSTAVTLTGTSGTANVNVQGVNYLATFDNNLTDTAAAFVTDHAAALLAAGVVVTSDAAVLTFVDEDENPPAITVTNVTTNLAGTVAASTQVEGDLGGGCQTVFQADVTTNIVCDECDPILVDMFTSEAPEPFDFVDWVKEEKVYSADALMGIRIKAKETISSPSEELRDATPFINSSIRLKVAGGYATETYNSFKTGRKRFSVKLISRQEELENLGGHLWPLEDRDFTYFNGHPRHRNFENGHMNEYTKQLLGEESVLKPNAQYVVYTVKVRPRTGQGIISDLVETFNYQIAAEVGLHHGVEALLNSLAGAAGVDGVQAYGA